MGVVAASSIWSSVANLYVEVFPVLVKDSVSKSPRIFVPWSELPSRCQRARSDHRRVVN